VGFIYVTIMFLSRNFAGEQGGRTNRVTRECPPAWALLRSTRHAMGHLLTVHHFRGMMIQRMM
jgi:hypothetical protein